jgi:hypothetical protein
VLQGEIWEGAVFMLYFMLIVGGGEAAGRREIQGYAQAAFGIS